MDFPIGHMCFQCMNRGNVSGRVPTWLLFRGGQPWRTFPCLIYDSYLFMKREQDRQLISMAKVSRDAKRVWAVYFPGRHTRATARRDPSIPSSSLFAPHVNRCMVGGIENLRM
jgi:hypothetical protein